MTRTYTIVLDPDADEGGYSVLVPSLPGCITQGGSVEECLERAREVIALHIAALVDDGEPVPEEQEHPQLLTVTIPA